MQGMQAAVPRPPVPEANVPLKKLHLDKVPYKRLEGTIWSVEIDAIRSSGLSVRFSTEEIEEGFAFQTAAEARAKRQAKEKEEAAAKEGARKEFKGFDAKAQQGFAIALLSRQMGGRGAAEIARLVDADHATITPEQVAALLDALPEESVSDETYASWQTVADEAEAKARAAGLPPPVLSPVQQLVLALGPPARLQQRLQLFQLRFVFEQRIARLRADSEVVHAAIGELRGSRSLARALELVLAVCNFLNQGSNAGGAWGLELGVDPDSLGRGLQTQSVLVQKLETCRTTDGSGSALIHYVALKLSEAGDGGRDGGKDDGSKDGRKDGGKDDGGKDGDKDDGEDGFASRLWAEMPSLRTASLVDWDSDSHSIDNLKYCVQRAASYLAYNHGLAFEGPTAELLPELTRSRLLKSKPRPENVDEFGTQLAPFVVEAARAIHDLKARRAEIASELYEKLYLWLGNKPSEKGAPGREGPGARNEQIEHCLGSMVSFGDALAKAHKQNVRRAAKAAGKAGAAKAGAPEAAAPAAAAAGAAGASDVEANGGEEEKDDNGGGGGGGGDDCSTEQDRERALSIGRPRRDTPKLGASRLFGRLARVAQAFGGGGGGDGGGDTAGEATGTVASAASDGTAAAADAAADATPAATPGDGGGGGVEEEWTATAWLRSNAVAATVAAALLHARPAGTSELDHLRSLGGGSGGFSGSDDDGGGKRALLALLQSGGLLEKLAEKLWPPLRVLAQAAAVTGAELHGKFVDEGVGFDLEYGGLKTFFGGLEAIVGAPDPRVAEGMRADHCLGPDASTPFETPNYRLSTNSEDEYHFVVDPSKLKAERRSSFEFAHEDPATLRGEARPRVAREPAEFAAEIADVNRRLDGLEQPRLSIEEFCGARLYTGPMYLKYNTALRGLQSSLAFFVRQFESLCLGNKYTTTLHVVNSAVVKLSKLTVAAKVFRGVANGRLPEHFRVRNEFGVRGGIDPAFMSTTLDARVAGQYVGAAGVVFHIQQGMVDRGADISWLSQCGCRCPSCTSARPLTPHCPMATDTRTSARSSSRRWRAWRCSRSPSTTRSSRSTCVSRSTSRRRRWSRSSAGGASSSRTWARTWPSRCGRRSAARASSRWASRCSRRRSTGRRSRARPSGTTRTRTSRRRSTRRCKPSRPCSRRGSASSG